MDLLSDSLLALVSSASMYTLKGSSAIDMEAPVDMTLKKQSRVESHLCRQMTGK